MNTQRPSNGILSNTTKKVSNISRQGVNKYKDSSTMGKVIFFVVLILIVFLIIYLTYYAVQASKNASSSMLVIVNDVIDAMVARPSVSLPQVTQGMNQSISTWIYIKSWNYNFGQYKNILWIGNPPSNGTAQATTRHSPSLWLYPLTNSLKVVTSTSAPGGVESCDIQNIPLMSWVNIVYVLNNRTVNIYINGLLERSCALQGIPVIANDPINVTAGGSTNAGFYGKIGKTVYYTYPLLPNDIANVYQQGPLGTNQYQVQFFTDGKFISFNQTPTFSDSS
jgi:hypothetical protein